MRLVLLPLALAAAVGCSGAADNSIAAGTGKARPAVSADGRPFQVEPVADFDEPWAMTFLPGGGYALITERSGRLRLWQLHGNSIDDVAGVPAVDHGGQGGLGDVVVHPNFEETNLVYLSYAEAGEGDTRGAAVGRGELVIDEMDGGAELRNFEVIWRQQPKVTGRGHFGHRLAFSPDGRYLFVTNGDRQKFDPAQDNSQHLGAVARLTVDGGTPRDNPFAGQGPVAAQIWSYGHRNPLGIAFAPDGRLWIHEMGPRNGDEFNLVERGANYGYPTVSNGDHYDGRPIPDHSTRPEFRAPVITWNGVSPAGLIIYTGDMFPQWRGNAFLGGLSGQTLIRVAIEGTSAREAERWDMGARIREVEQGPDGAIYLLEDGGRGSQGRLLRLTPAR